MYSSALCYFSVWRDLMYLNFNRLLTPLFVKCQQFGHKQNDNMRNMAFDIISILYFLSTLKIWYVIKIMMRLR